LAASGNSGGGSSGGGSGQLIGTTSDKSTALGLDALKSITTGANNTALGLDALKSVTTGSDNTAVGHNALSVSASIRNTAIGSDAMKKSNGSSYNTAVGWDALGSCTNSSNCNTAVGCVALGSNTIGCQNNTGIGYGALRSSTTGSDNIALGYNAGYKLSDNYLEQIKANKSIFIGVDSKGSADDDQTNQIVIGFEAIGGGSNTITLGNSSITKLRCQVTSITALSDMRVKEDIEPADLEKCADAVRGLPIMRYKYKDFTGTHLDKHVTGFMAEDVEKVFPKAVSKTDQYFPVLDENSEPVFEDIEEEVKDIAEDGTETTRVETRSVAKMFLMKAVKDITMTEAIPTLWGAVQYLLNRIETLEGELNGA
jgi:hypothetical protein